MRGGCPGPEDCWGGVAGPAGRDEASAALSTLLRGAGFGPWDAGQALGPPACSAGSSSSSLESLHGGRSRLEGDIGAC